MSDKIRITELEDALAKIIVCWKNSNVIDGHAAIGWAEDLLSKNNPPLPEQKKKYVLKWFGDEVRIVSDKGVCLSPEKCYCSMHNRSLPCYYDEKGVKEYLYNYYRARAEEILQSDANEVVEQFKDDMHSKP